VRTRWRGVFRCGRLNFLLQKNQIFRKLRRDRTARGLRQCGLGSWFCADVFYKQFLISIFANQTRLCLAKPFRDKYDVNDDSVAEKVLVPSLWRLWSQSHVLGSTPSLVTRRCVLKTRKWTTSKRNAYRQI